ncbi:MAG: 50S ribosomal protein L29 [Candidatus Doudnabacteria bacterium]
MKYSEITKLSPADLQKNLKELQENLQNMRMKNKLGQLKNAHEISKVKRDIARILTYIRAN